MGIGIYYFFQILIWLVNVYIWAIVIYALLSWFPGAYQSRFGQLLVQIVQPFLNYFEFIHVGVLGFGPIVAIIVLTIVQYGLTYLQTIFLQLVQ
ncbi:YggT family protein [Levilactobacillus bambusae]|uniref:YggT family protein n=1 Tax=Levilactobacillus bambusae TaxID=2024736 RepID=A0A2V1N0P4_9LACO|nr:YggT family protein [Levilactobacillus bambusae]PWG00642.1 YggT family protein [Levilactobacillus bambusae]